MMFDRLVCVGLSHETAPVALREQLSHWPAVDVRTAAIEELVILCTCNRLELYAYIAETEDDTSVVSSTGAPGTTPQQALIDLIAQVQGIAPEQFIDHLYHYEGEAVVAHLARVAAGLESLILGEGQILGQVNGALQQAYGVKSVGPMLALLFRIGISAGKRARTETRISTNAVSVSSAAVSLVAQVRGLLHKQHVAVIGLGEMGELALKGLVGRGVSMLTLVNRSPHKAERLAERYHGQPRPLHELAQVLSNADIVFTATSAQQPLITAELLQIVLPQRKAVAGAIRPLTLIDLAVPRNIDARVAELEGVQLFDVDDLRQVVDEALAVRQAQVPAVEAIIDELLDEWRKQMHALRLRPVVVALRQQAEMTRQQLLARTLRHLERQQGIVNDAVVSQLEYLSQALVNHLLHEPTVKLKAAACTTAGPNYAALVADLFALDVSIPAVVGDEATDIAADITVDVGWEFELNDELTMAFLATDFATNRTAELGNHAHCSPNCTTNPCRYAPSLPKAQPAWHYELVGQP